MSTEAPRRGDTATYTYKGFPGYTFERKTVGFAYARNGLSKPGMQGNGTPRYRWTVLHGNQLIGSGTTLKAVKETAEIHTADPS